MYGTKKIGLPIKLGNPGVFAQLFGAAGWIAANATPCGGVYCVDQEGNIVDLTMDPDLYNNCLNTSGFKSTIKKPNIDQYADKINDYIRRKY